MPLRWVGSQTDQWIDRHRKRHELELQVVTELIFGRLIWQCFFRSAVFRLIINIEIWFKIIRARMKSDVDQRHPYSTTIWLRRCSKVVTAIDSNWPHFIKPNAWYQFPSGAQVRILPASLVFVCQCSVHFLFWPYQIRLRPPLWVWMRITRQLSPSYAPDRLVQNESKIRTESRSSSRGIIYDDIRRYIVPRSRSAI